MLLKAGSKSKTLRRWEAIKFLMQQTAVMCEDMKHWTELELVIKTKLRLELMKIILRQNNSLPFQEREEIEKRNYIPRDILQFVIMEVAVLIGMIDRERMQGTIVHQENYDTIMTIMIEKFRYITLADSNANILSDVSPQSRSQEMFES